MFSQVTPSPAVAFQTPSLTAHSQSVSTASEIRTKILLITDDSETIQIVQSALMSQMEIFQAPSSTEGISILNKDCPDLILCDLQSDFEDLRMALKSADFCDIPFLLLSAFPGRLERIHLLADGVADILVKPFKKEELLYRVYFQLERFRAKKILQNELKKNSPLDQLAQEAAAKIRELQKLNKLKDEFIAILSHELRNPINVISGYAEILFSEKGQNPATRSAAEAIHRNAQIQAQLINDLLDVSRGIAGKLVLDCKPMDIGSLMKDLIAGAEEAAEKKEIYLEYQQGLHLGLINGDSTRVAQVIWNLLSNALKFTPQHGKIQVQLEQKEQWIELSVQDSGVGIDPQFLPTMFERYHQQDPTITKNFGGLGLGLAIVRHLVELHGGSVQASSDGVGHGATFLIRLPALPN